jgi:hypothetical protein
MATRFKKLSRSSRNFYERGLDIWSFGPRFEGTLAYSKFGPHFLSTSKKLAHPSLTCCLCRLKLKPRTDKEGPAPSSGKKRRKHAGLCGPDRTEPPYTQPRAQIARLADPLLLLQRFFFHSSAPPVRPNPPNPPNPSPPSRTFLPRARR